MAANKKHASHSFCSFLATQGQGGRQSTLPSHHSLVRSSSMTHAQASLSCSEALLCDALLRARESDRPSCAAMGASALLGASSTEDSEPLIESAGGVVQLLLPSSVLLPPPRASQLAEEAPLFSYTRKFRPPTDYPRHRQPTRRKSGIPPSKNIHVPTSSRSAAVTICPIPSLCHLGCTSW